MGRFYRDFNLDCLIDEKGELSDISFSDKVDFAELEEFMNKQEMEKLQYKRDLNTLKYKIRKLVE